MTSLMQMKSLSNQALHEKLSSLCSEERRITLEILHHFREAERRYLYAERGHSSLFEYAVSELKYSESAAQRRISAMRLIRELPELDVKVGSGELKLTQLSQIQSFLRSEKKDGKTYSQDQKKALILETVGRSSRGTEKLLAEKSPGFATHEKVRVITPALTEIRFSADEALMQNIEQVRNRFAHQLPAGTGIADVFRFLCEKALKEDQKKRVGAHASSKAEDVGSGGGNVVSPRKSVFQARDRVQTEAPEESGTGAHQPQSEESPPAPAVETRSRYIPLPVKRAVWKRDQGRCTYQSETTGKRCNSIHRIEIDHKVPFALGGSSTDVASLRLLYWAHNQLEARRVFGERSDRRS